MNKKSCNRKQRVLKQKLKKSRTNVLDRKRTGAMYSKSYHRDWTYKNKNLLDKQVSELTLCNLYQHAENLCQQDNKEKEKEKEKEREMKTGMETKKEKKQRIVQVKKINHNTKEENKKIKEKYLQLLENEVCSLSIENIVTSAKVESLNGERIQSQTMIRKLNSQTEGLQKEIEELKNFHISKNIQEPTKLKKIRNQQDQKNMKM
ncbi:hypothetical protein M0813_19670 [Anaeramoeba flamelloides]|uniref:Uncharacterized protein n=1 Tax=Anaeramoeba flamelloides TaxID=1746091 RepID=A0ABQ8YMT3_9EUKA|nr:hypothetical protein M0813_19670 [Anaeramoeba flamelloides]